MTRFNVNNPTVAGLEWHADQQLAKTLRSTPGQVAVFNSTVNESIDTLTAYLDVGTTPAKVQFDIYDTTNVGRSTVDQNGDAAQPIADQQVDAGWVRSDGATFNLYVAVNDIQTAAINADDPALTSDFIKLVGTGTGGGGITNINQDALFTRNAPFTNRTTGAASDPLTSRRVISLRIRASVVFYGPSGSATVDGLLRLAQGLYTSPQGPTVLRPQGQVPPGQIQGEPTQEVVWEWFTNPRTGFPWTREDIDGFPFNVNTFGVRGANFGNNQTVLRVYNCQFEVMTTEDRRIVYARRTLTVPGAGWQNFPLQSMATDNNTTWSKVAGKQYAIVAYSPLGTISWRALVDSTGGALPDQSFALWDLESHGAGVTAAAAFSQTSPPTSPAACAYVLTSGGSNSPDSQPYAQTIASPVTALTSFQQEIGNTGGLPYGIVSLLARPAGAVGAVSTVTAPMQISLRRRSDSALLAGPVTVQATDLGNLVDGNMHLVQVEFSTAPTLSAGTQYFVEATSATNLANPWYVQCLSTIDATFGNITFRGTADSATRASSQTTTSESTADDAPVTIKTVPPALNGLSAVAQSQTIQPALVGGCTVGGIGYASISWNPSSLGGTFFCYEVQRFESPDWVVVARPLAESSAFFNDFELHRNTDTEYRVRVVRGDGAFSNWSQSNTVNVAAGSADVLLVSNVLPDLNVGYMDETPHTWTLPDGDALVLDALYGQDKYSAFRPTEKRGDKFTKSLIVAFNDLAIGATVQAGRQVFHPLENIAHSVLVPYVTVCDGDGNRWYTAPKITSMTRTEPLKQYKASVDFAEVNGPTPVQAAIPWSPGVVAVGLVYGDLQGTYGDAGGTYGSV